MILEDITVGDKYQVNQDILSYLSSVFGSHGDCLAEKGEAVIVLDIDICDEDYPIKVKNKDGEEFWVAINELDEAIK